MIPAVRRPLVFHGTKMFFAEDRWASKLKRIGISYGNDWRDLSPGVNINTSSITNCFRVSLDTGDTVYFKRYVYVPLKKKPFWLKPSKAAIEAWSYAQLTSLSIPTLEVLALGERRFLGALETAFIVTLGVDNSIALNDFAREEWSFYKPNVKKRIADEIAYKLLAQAKTAHNAGFFHHDLKWRNILIKKSSDHFTPVWIDCPKGSYKHLNKHRGIVVDFSGLARLATLYLSIKDQLRYFNFYSKDQFDYLHKKNLVRHIIARLNRRLPSHMLGTDK